ncbi:MAG: histidinol-phosphate transaminase [Gammaproteobacteria bacterium]|nr:histidinol-phosphate transaminase [Gammaproteobacteria bacterium]
MSRSPIDLAAPGVREINPYQPGKPIDELEREYGISNSIKLASNENPLGPGAEVLAAIAKAAPESALYPDGNGFHLKETLAARHNVDIDRITLGNGSNDVLVLLAEAFLTPELEAIYSEYAFAVYPLAVQAVGAEAKVSAAQPGDSLSPLGHDLHEMEALISDKTRLIFIANPNNPTGTWIKSRELRDFIEMVPDHALVVVDEAYFDYLEEQDFPDTSQWLEDFPNLVVTRTFSKAYGLAGLRIGYSLSHPDVANVLNRIRQPFNVNSLALEAARAALGDQTHLQRSVDMNNEQREIVAAGLKDLGLRFIPSVANFILVDMDRPAMPIYEGLLHQGVIVRPVGNYGLPEHLRISIGTPKENQRLLDALRQVL